MIEIPITTERLIVRQFMATDLDAYIRFMLDRDSTRWLAFDDEQKTEAGARALFDYVLQSYDSPDVVHAYAIADAQTEAYVGSCGFAPYGDGIVECYYAINSEHRKNGFATEASQALIAAISPFFEVRAYCHAENFAAHAVATRCDMTPMGFGLNANSGLEGLLFVKLKGI